MKNKNTITAAQRFEATRWLDANLDDLIGLSNEQTRSAGSEALGYELATIFIRSYLQSHPRSEEIRAARPNSKPRRTSSSRDSVEIAEPLLDALASLGRYDRNIVARVDELRTLYRRSRLTTNLRKPRPDLLADPFASSMPIFPAED